MAAFLAPFLISLATSVVLGIASQLIRGSPRGPKPLVQDEFRVPTTEDGREIPWIFGRVVCSGPNVLHYELRGNQRIRRRSGPFSKTTVGRRYDFGLHFGFCYEPETVHRFIWGGKTVFARDYTIADDTSRLQTRLDNLFGGDSGEGGLNGDLQLLFGAPDQVLAGNVLEDLGGNTQFRGFFSAYWRGVCTTTPYIKPVEVEVSRYTAGWESGTAWYPETAYVPAVDDATTVIAATDEWEWFTGPEQSNPGNTRLTIPGDFLPFSLGLIRAFSANPPAAGPFGSGTASGQTPPANNLWPQETVLWLRKNFTVPTDSTLALTVRVENGCVIFIDGVDIGAINRDNAPITSYPTETFTIPLTAGAHTLHIKAFDETVGAHAATYVRAVGVLSTNVFFANPAHIVYELITTARPRGMGYPTAAIDDTNFRAAADTFFGEGMGLCVKWEFSGALRELIEGVASHAGMIVRQSSSTGLWQIVPLRADYTVGDLPLFDESNIVRVSTFERAGGGEQVTSITGKYRDVFVREDRVTPAARNLALIQQQEADIGEQRDYPYAPTEAICARLVDRDLQIAGLPLALIEIEVNRSGYNIQEGDVVRVVDARIGVNPIVMRVLAVDEGDLNDGTIVLRGNEDQFGLANFVSTNPQPIDFTPPDERALPTTQVVAFELPHEIATAPGGVASVPNLIGYVGALAAPPPNLTTEFDLYSAVNPAELAADEAGQFVPAATIASAVLQQQTAILLSNPLNLSDVQIGDYAVIGLGAEAEWTYVVAVGSTDVLVRRGMLDTTPALTAWPVGTPIWFTDGTEAVSENTYTEGDLVTLAISTRSTNAVLPLASSPQVSITLDNRAARPLPPGNVLINGDDYPLTVTGTLTITWSARDRLTQPPNVFQDIAIDYGPEAGVTYNVYAYDATTETLLDSDTGLTGTSWSPVLPDAYPLRIEIEAERAGLTSWQRQARQFVYVSGGLEARSIDAADDDSRETDDGEIRLIN